MRGRPGKDVEQSPVDLAAIIADAKLDVLALEEIGVEKNEAPFTSKPLEKIFAQLKSAHGQSWQYILFPKTDYPKDTEDFITRGQAEATRKLNDFTHHAKQVQPHPVYDVIHLSI